MEKTKKIADVLLGLMTAALLVKYVLWAVSFIGRYEPTMDPLHLILWRRFLDGPALTLAVWGLLQGTYLASRSSGKGFYWWSMLPLGGLFALLYCWAVVTYTDPALPVSIDPHQIVAAIGGVCLAVWSVICAVVWLVWWVDDRRRRK